MALVTVQGMAQDKQRGKRIQDRGDRMERFQDFTPEEVAGLKTKKLTLELDLTDSQQDKIYAINLEQAKVRKEHGIARKKQKEKGENEKPSKEERLERMNERLDRQIAVKKKMKAVLDKDQYNKWSERSSRHRAKKNAHGNCKRKK